MEVKKGFYVYLKDGVYLISMTRPEGSWQFFPDYGDAADYRKWQIEQDEKRKVI